MSMQNKVWFITGVSRGFGEALAKTLLSQGNTVIGTTRDAPPAFAQGQKSFHWLKLDVTDTANAVRDVVNAAFTITGRIDVLVNNAGYGLIGSVEEATEEQVEHLFAVNFHGLRRVTQASLPHLRRQRAGHIINISSMAGLAANPGSAMYSAAKFAVEGLSCGLAKEIAPLGLNLTLIEPGAFRTDFLSTNSIRRSKLQVQLAGLACGYLPDYLAAPYLASGRLIAKKVENKSNFDMAYLGWNESANGLAALWWREKLLSCDNWGAIYLAKTADAQTAK